MEEGPDLPHPGVPHPGAPVHSEPPGQGLAGRLNWLRAGVLGANDGIVSVAGVVVAVAGASTDRAAIATAGMAALVAGAVSMALGEYVSVSTQRDSERAMLAKEQAELREMPEEELAELAALYRAKGLSDDTAWRVARELTAHDALAAHLDAELHIDRENLANPYQAAAASAVAFVAGAALPMAAVLIPATTWRVPVTALAVLLALALTGATSARLGGAAPGRAIVRVVVGGAAGLAITYLIGSLFGAAVG